MRLVLAVYLIFIGLGLPAFVLGACDTYWQVTSDAPTEAGTYHLEMDSNNKDYVCPYGATATSTPSNASLDNISCSGDDPYVFSGDIELSAGDTKITAYEGSFYAKYCEFNFDPIPEGEGEGEQEEGLFWPTPTTTDYLSTTQDFVQAFFFSAFLFLATFVIVLKS